MKKTIGFLACLSGVAMWAQTATTQSTANPLSGSTKLVYDHLKTYIIKSAEEMPEADYGYKPVATVRTFGQLVGHVADAQYEFCGPVNGDGKKSPDVEKTKTTKTELIAALKEAFAYCDQAYDSLTDAHAADMAKFGTREMPKLTVLSINNAHTDEHYGNMVTYLRMKGLVPPSSQGKM